MSAPNRAPVALLPDVEFTSSGRPHLVFNFTTDWPGYRNACVAEMSDEEKHIVSAILIKGETIRKYVIYI